MSAQASTAGVMSAVSTSTAAQIASRGVHFVLNVIAGLALIRYFGPAGYGDYAFVLTYATLFGLLSDFGLSKVAVRDMSREPGAEGAVLGTAMATRVVLSLAAALLAQIGAILLGVREELRAVVAVASLLFLVESLLSVMAVFQVRLAMQYEAIVATAIQALDTAIILALISLKASLIVIVGSPVVSGAIGITIALALVRRRFPLAMRVDVARLRRLLIESAPVGLTTMIVVLYVKTDAVILGLLATPTDVGLFAAAYKPIEYALLALMLPINVLFPLLARWCGTDRRLFQLVYWRGADALLAFTLPIAVVVFVGAGPIVTALYAADFASSTTPLRLLALGLPLMVLSAWQGFALLAGGHQRVTVAYDAAALVVNVSANLVLIPAIGYMGATIAAFATSLFVAICAWTAAGLLLDVRGEAGLRLRSIVLANGALAVVLVGGSLVAPVWAALPVAMALYPFWLLVFGAVTRAEVVSLLPMRRTASVAERP